MIRKYTRPERLNDLSQRFPDKVTDLLGKIIVIIEVEKDENPWGTCVLFTYHPEDDEDNTRKGQTNSQVLMKQLMEQKEEGLPVRVKIAEVKSNKSRNYFYTLTDPDQTD